MMMMISNIKIPIKMNEVIRLFNRNLDN